MSSEVGTLGHWAEFTLRPVEQQEQAARASRCLYEVRDMAGHRRLRDTSGPGSSDIQQST